MFIAYFSLIESMDCGAKHNNRGAKHNNRGAKHNNRGAKHNNRGAKHNNCDVSSAETGIIGD